MQGRMILPMLLISVAGCQEATSAIAKPRATREPTILGQSFDAADTGTLEGVVVWEADEPATESLDAVPYFSYFKMLTTTVAKSNPHRPRIDAESRGVGRAVVFLRKVDAARSRPWNHPPVRVEFQANELDRIVSVMGETPTPVGFVRRGESITIRNKQPWLNILEGQGAKLISQPMPADCADRERCLDESGHVELLSGSQAHWMRGHLLVSDHPYLTTTDAQGRFRLDQIPKGAYEVVCWHPNWKIARREMNPDTLLVSRVIFQAPIEIEKTITIDAGKTATTRFVMK